MMNSTVRNIIELPRFKKSKLSLVFDNANRPEGWEADGTAHGGINKLYGLFDLVTEYFKLNEQGVSNFKVVEIGCFAGVSTALFAATCQYVYAVDPWSSSEGYDELSKPELDEAELDFDMIMSQFSNFAKIKDYSHNAVKLFENKSLDAVYIDGAHDRFHVRQDFDMWIPKIKSGGVLCGHDYHSIYVNEALKDYFPNQYPPHHYCDCSWAVPLL